MSHLQESAVVFVNTVRSLEGNLPKTSHVLAFSSPKPTASIEDGEQLWGEREQ